MADSILVLNTGSSSLKFSVFHMANGNLTLQLRGQIEKLDNDPHFVVFDSQGRQLEDRRWKATKQLDHALATMHLLDWLRSGQWSSDLIHSVGHRVVHGGVVFTGPVKINEDVMACLEELVPLAPLHQPQSLAVIRAVAQAMPTVPQVATFDTSFHHDRPQLDQLIALPERFTNDGIRRYGFHGLSYEYIAFRLKELDPAAFAGRTIVAHLGNGASMCALRAGKSVATTMGFTGLDGLPMGTRSGTIDPGLVLYLLNHYHLDSHQLEQILYRESGLLAISGISSDVRALLASDDLRAQLAIDYFVHRIGRALGSLAGGIGENSVEIRAAICRNASWLGVELDEANHKVGNSQISLPNSRVIVRVIPTNEELMIAKHTQRVLWGTPTP